MTDSRITWHPRIIYKGMRTRSQARAALGTINWATQPPAQFIARIHKLRELRNQLAEQVLGNDTDPYYEQMLQKIQGCLPRYAPFIPKPFICGRRWFCPFCFARSAGRTWEAIDRGLFDKVYLGAGPNAESTHQHELQDRAMIYQTRLGPLLSLRSTTGPRSFRAWLAARKVERRREFKEWSTERRVKVMIESIYMLPLESGELRPEIRQLIFITARGRFRTPPGESFRVLEPSRADVAMKIGELKEYPRWLLRESPATVSRFMRAISDCRLSSIFGLPQQASEA